MFKVPPIKRRVTIEQVKQGIADHYGQSWVFNLLRSSGWEDSKDRNATRIVIDGLDINIYEMDTVIGLHLWFSSTAQVATYIGHSQAIDIEIEKLYRRLYNDTNYVYERARNNTSVE